MPQADRDQVHIVALLLVMEVVLVELCWKPWHKGTNLLNFVISLKFKLFRFYFCTKSSRNKSMLLAKKPSQKPSSPEKPQNATGPTEPYKLEGFTLILSIFYFDWVLTWMLVAVIKLVQLNFEIELFECTIRHFDSKPHSEAVIPLLKVSFNNILHK